MTQNEPVPSASPSEAPAPLSSAEPSPLPAVSPIPERITELRICSFNIQFLGSFDTRDNVGLARVLQAEACDVIVIQELVAPPSEAFLDKNHRLELDGLLSAENTNLFTRFFPFVEGATPEPLRPVAKATWFFEAMAEAGFADFVLSEEKTGPTENRSNGSSSEWWIAFYRPDRIRLAPDLPHGFLSTERVANPSFERVPYAFPFRSLDGGMDFVLISVHLAPGKSEAPRRRQELDAISAWIAAHSAQERDFLVLGDMNIESATELGKATPLRSLNQACVPTNTIPKPASAKPYDHVLFDPESTTALELAPEREGRPNFEVIDLRSRMRTRWAERHPGEPYPGGTGSLDSPADGYIHDRFRTEYSDHQPVKFLLSVPEKDDDGVSGDSSGP